MNASTFSTLLSDPSVQPAKIPKTQTDPKLPRNVEYNYNYISFHYLPDGSTDLSSTSGTIWYLTLQNVNDKPTGNTPPANFFTLQIDPVSGTTKNFRPGA